MVAYLLDSLLVATLELHNLTGALARVFDLFPRLHLLLLEQRDSVS